MTQHIFNTMATNREHNFMPHAEVAVFVREDLTFRRFVNFEGRYLSSFCYVVTRTFVSEPTYACTGPTVVMKKRIRLTVNNDRCGFDFHMREWKRMYKYAQYIIKKISSTSHQFKLCNSSFKNCKIYWLRDKM